MIKLLVENIVLPLQENESQAVEIAKKRITKTLHSPVSGEWRIYRKSVDARNKNQICYVYSVQCVTDDSVLKYEALLASRKIKIVPVTPLSFQFGKEKVAHQISVIGFGPAGMFCSLLLAENGFKPVVYERGGSVDERIQCVETFLKTKVLDTECNIQFGAGGAGTFSDGKLTTRINDPLCDYVLQKFVSFGAPEEILYKAKPHIGTDNLRLIVKNMDAYIRQLGGEIHYHSRVDAVHDSYIVVNGQSIPSDATVLAIGHSARELYRQMIQENFAIQPKAFSCGVRVEHLQSELDLAMYGSMAGSYGLEHADYALSYREGERGVYSFCMCPGGFVMASSSENGTIVTNGMSNFARDGKNANAAINVSVLPEDYGNTPEGAIQFQEKLERDAYAAGGGHFAAPVQLMKDFLSGQKGTMPGRIMPTYMDGNVTATDLNQLFPSFISQMLQTGFRYFGRKIRGFDADDVPLTGVESRTSSPIRIVRDDRFLALAHNSIYPCGEGAGYAGGIMSAAVDGIRVGAAIMARFVKN